MPSSLSPGSTLSGYAAFYEAVAAAQLEEWLPEDRCRVVDLSGSGGRYGELVSAAGHDVLHVVAPTAHLALPPAARRRLPRVVAESQDLAWLHDASVDGVLAEASALSVHLAAEATFAEVARVLRPGGRFLLCVDSLVLGLAQLAGQGRWAELADVPLADVVLVPQPDGSIRRCFWPEQLVEDLDRGGFDVEWVRPRTVLPFEVVERALRTEASALSTLVRTEVKLEREREGQSIGDHVVASARKRG